MQLLWAVKSVCRRYALEIKQFAITALRCMRATNSTINRIPRIDLFGSRYSFGSTEVATVSLEQTETRKGIHKSLSGTVPFPGTQHPFKGQNERNEITSLTKKVTSLTKNMKDDNESYLSVLIIIHTNIRVHVSPEKAISGGSSYKKLFTRGHF